MTTPLGTIVHVTEGFDDQRILIVLDYLPPNPRPDTVPVKVAVWCPESDAFLRYYEEPFWDLYGDDMGTIERAKDAIARAPKPRKPYYVTTFPLNKPASRTQEA